MGNFQIPLYQYIINADRQLDFYINTGSGLEEMPEYDSVTPVHSLDPTDSTHSFALIGELDWTNASDVVLLESGVRVRKVAPSVGTLQSVDFTVVVPSGQTIPKGTVIRVVTSMPSVETSEFQNIPLEKRYTLSRDCTTAEQVADDIVALINDDPSALVAASGGIGEFTVTDKSVLQESWVYVGRTPEGDIPFGLTGSIVTPRYEGVNNYEMMKNLQWPVNLEIDRNVEYFPIAGDLYNSYYFRIIREEQPVGGFSLPSQVPQEAETEHVFYVNTKLTSLIAQFEQFNYDMNI